MQKKCNVGVIGNSGSFGSFLVDEIIPSLGLELNIEGIDENSAASERIKLIENSTDIVMCVPLQIYATEVKRLLPELLSKNTPTILWLIPSIQSPTVQIVADMLQHQEQKNLYCVAVHPMYGSNSFSNSTFERRASFQNIITFVSDDILKDKLEKLSGIFKEKFNIQTITDYAPSEHDKAVAKSQGLAYCVALKMYKYKSLANEIEKLHPQLYKPFTSDKELIQTFTALNPYFKETENIFEFYWQSANQVTLNALLYAFTASDLKINGINGATIINQRYLYLREISRYKNTPNKACT